MMRASAQPRKTESMASIKHLREQGREPKVVGEREVRRRVQEVRAAMLSKDHDVAHTREDELWRDVLHTIAEGKTDDPRKLARMAVATNALDFVRYSA